MKTIPVYLIPDHPESHFDHNIQQNLCLSNDLVLYELTLTIIFQSLPKQTQDT